MSDKFKNLKKESMHHAFVVQGDVQSNKSNLYDFLQKEFNMSVGHNDLTIFNRGDFGIDDVQEIININSRKPVSGDIKVLIVEMHSISHQAQNAILKTLEEPRPGTYIFILTNTASIFLPTILSRVQVLSSGDIGSGDATKGVPRGGNSILDAELFIKNSSTQRLSQIKKMLDLKTDEEIGDAEIFAFIQEVERKAHAYSTESGGLDVAQDTTRTVAQVFTKVSEYMRDPSSSKKLLLEYMALRLPTL